MHIELIAGSREFPNLKMVEDYVWDDLESGTLVITGGARGVDTTACVEAKARGLHTKEFPVTGTEWMLFGRRAGRMRNMHMIEYMNIIRSSFPNNTYKVTIFSEYTNGKLTAGSQSMLEIAQNHNYDFIVIEP